MVPEKVWESLAKRVREGETNAIKTWLQYRFGMPKQIIEQTNINPDRPNIVFIKKTK